MRAPFDVSRDWTIHERKVAESTKYSLVLLRLLLLLYIRMYMRAVPQLLFAEGGFDPFSQHLLSGIQVVRGQHSAKPRRFLK